MSGPEQLAFVIDFKVVSKPRKFKCAAKGSNQLLKNIKAHMDSPLFLKFFIQQW